VVMDSSPFEPGVVTGLVLVTGPVQSMSKLTRAAVETGDWNRNRALGMLKKSLRANVMHPHACRALVELDFV